MKRAVTALAMAMTFVWLIPEDASAQSRGVRKKPAKKFYRIAQRPASVGPNGLCQRDTGTPTSQLNFRNRCDTEEFWNRMNERGSFGRR